MRQRDLIPGLLEDLLQGLSHMIVVIYEQNTLSVAWPIRKINFLLALWSTGLFFGEED